jgi:hypothetical protein
MQRKSLIAQLGTILWGILWDWSDLPRPSWWQSILVPIVLYWMGYTSATMRYAPQAVSDNLWRRSLPLIIILFLAGRVFAAWSRQHPALNSTAASASRV